jgi:hypothetical protein
MVRVEIEDTNRRRLVKSVGSDLNGALATRGRNPRGAYVAKVEPACHGRTPRIPFYDTGALVAPNAQAGDMGKKGMTVYHQCEGPG